MNMKTVASEVDLLGVGMDKVWSFSIVSSFLFLFVVKQVTSLIAKHVPFSAVDALDPTLNPFIASAKPRLDRLRAQVFVFFRIFLSSCLKKKAKTMTESFRELCTFFGDDPTTESEEFFGRIDEFIKLRIKQSG